MKKIFSLIFLVIAAKFAFAQSIKKNWILVKSENLTHETPITEEVKYHRYYFTGDNVYISAYPGWCSAPYPSALNGNLITVGFANYTIENLTDSTLVFASAGFKRFSLISEAKYARLKVKYDTTTAVEGCKVYIADNYFTPRLKKQYLISDFIKMSDYNIRREIIFNAKFVVSDKGKIERVDIVNDINSGFDQEFKELLMKTSGKWEPAMLNNKAVYSELTYTIHYLDSIVPD